MAKGRRRPSREEKRPKRGNGAKAHERHSSNWYSKGRQAYLDKRHKDMLVHELEKHPDHFDRVSSNGKVVLDSVEELYPGGTQALRQESAHRPILFRPSLRAQKFLPFNHPGVYVIKITKLLSRLGVTAISEAWRDLMKLEPTYLYDRNGNNRSTTPSFHFGMWSHSSPLPCITSDTRRHSPAICKAINRFLKAIAKYLAPHIRMLLRYYAPDVYERQMNAYRRVKALLGQEEWWVDFLGAFFTVAAKEGSSEIPHIDFNDDNQSITWAVPIGEFTGGEFCTPQLDSRIPVLSGQGIGCNTRRIVHYGTPTQGNRLVLTLFCDKTLMSGFEKGRY